MIFVPFCRDYFFLFLWNDDKFVPDFLFKKARENPHLGVDNDIHKKPCENPWIGCNFHQWTNLFRSGLKNMWSCVCTAIWSMPPPPAYNVCVHLFTTELYVSFGSHFKSVVFFFETRYMHTPYIPCLVSNFRLLVAHSLSINELNH